MKTNDVNRICPKCGMILGQKNLCPICDKTEQILEKEDRDNVFSYDSIFASQIINFVTKHPDSWDDEFNAFFDGLDIKHDFVECYGLCSKVSDILKNNTPKLDSISGSMTIKVMTELKSVFSNLSNEESREFAIQLLQKKVPFSSKENPLKENESFIVSLKAAEEGNSEAQYHLGNCYWNGQGVNKNRPEAIKWYRMAAEQGHIKAQANLGICYYEGEGVNKDYSEAVNLCRKAAEQGDANAQYVLGLCYFDGNGVTKNISEAINLCHKSAEQGDSRGQFFLGEIYYNGDGVSQDYAEAIKWYRMSAEQGYALAQFKLGSCLLFGKGASRDYTEAVKWLQVAAEQNKEEAQCWLGFCYEKGKGVKKDYVEATKWYSKAAEQGHIGAISALSRIKKYDV